MGATFGELHRLFRLRAGLGLRRYALRVGDLPSNVCSMESGRRPPWRSREKLRKSAEVLGLMDGSRDWDAFFSAARAPGQLPADAEDLFDKSDLMPVVYRSLKRLSEKDIQDLVAWLKERQGVSDDAD